MRMTAILAALALVACAAQPGQALPGSAATSTLNGRYVVTAIDGAKPVIPISGHRPTVTIAGTRIHFQSQCINFDWTLRRAGSDASTSPYEPGSASCRRGLAPGEKAIERAFNGLSAIAPAAGGGLRVQGGGHRLELSPAV